MDRAYAARGPSPACAPGRWQQRTRCEPRPTSPCDARQPPLWVGPGSTDWRRSPTKRDPPCTQTSPPLQPPAALRLPIPCGSAGGAVSEPAHTAQPKLSRPARGPNPELLQDVGTPAPRPAVPKPRWSAAWQSVGWSVARWSVARWSVRGGRWRGGRWRGGRWHGR